MPVHFLKSATAVVLILTVITCGTMDRTIDLKIYSKKKLEHIPSASGTTVHDGHLYVVSDNQPWLFKSDFNGNLISKFRIIEKEDNQNEPIPKLLKPDFEALTKINLNGEEKLLVFGSGSLSPQRNVLLLVGIGNNFKTSHYLLTGIYEQLQSYLGDAPINIEAAVVYGEFLMLFNRQNNTMVRYNLEQFLNAVIHKAKLPTPELKKIILPKVKNATVGISGASMLPNSAMVLFTTSIEATDNPIDDGEIMGSYLGIMDLGENNNQIQSTLTPIVKDDRVLKIKVESVVVTKTFSNKNFDIVMVTDNDAGVSEILAGNITLQ